MLASASAVTSASLTLRCSVLIGHGALHDTDAVSALFDELMVSIADINDRFGRVRARTAITDAAIEAFSMCAMIPRWNELRSLALSDDEVRMLWCLILSIDYSLDAIP